MFRRLVDAFEIPFFNRVSAISYSVNDLSEIPLHKEEVAQLRELEKISVARYGAKPVDDLEIKAAQELVPACRLGSVESTRNRIDIQVEPGSRFACCAP